MMEPGAPVESVEAFQLRARAWLAENLPRAADTELSDIDTERVTTWLREQRDNGTAKATSNAWLAACRAFCT